MPTPPASLRHSRDSKSSTITSSGDSKHLFRATIADIYFRPSHQNASCTFKDEMSMRDLFDIGPSSIMDNKSPQARWIHVPGNNMAWVEALMAVLHREQMAQNAERDEGDQQYTKFNGVLHDDLWKRAFHGRHSASIHSRFMMPLATRYSSINPDDPESDDSDTSWQNANVTALYMPYLHWEFYNDWKHRQRHIATMKQLHQKGQSCDCLAKPEDHPNVNTMNSCALLHEHLLTDSPLHDRRSLDQSYYYNLRNVAHYDEDQIIGQHTWDKVTEMDPRRKMMMTDQLWMWVVDGKTIITAFPETGTRRGNEADILYRIKENLPRAVAQCQTKSVNGLVALIIDHCSGVFHRSDINPSLAFIEFFADEIGAAKCKLDKMFHDFREAASSIEPMFSDYSISVAQMSRALDGIFSVRHQIKLMEELEKIMSDLSKIDFLLGQQETVARDLMKCNKSGRGPSRSLVDLCEVLKTRRDTWAGMAETAKNTHQSLHGLLDLKQRQAAVSEARTVRFQTEIAAKQGQSIMLLTMFTIFFLPVSVMGTMFGMNAKEINGGLVGLRTICATMFPTTVMLVLLVLLFAFNEQSRDVLKHLWQVVHAKWADRRSERSRRSHV